MGDRPLVRRGDARPDAWTTQDHEPQGGALEGSGEVTSAAPMGNHMSWRQALWQTIGQEFSSGACTMTIEPSGQ